MKNIKPQIKKGWVNIRVRRETVKRLKVGKAELELAVYDDLINLALDEMEDSK